MDKKGSKGIFRLGGLLPEVFRADSNAIVRSDLTRKMAAQEVQWNAECEKAFEKLKSLLCGEPELKCPDFQKTFVLQTDASDRGVGAVLSQMYDGEDHPAAYFSWKPLPREEKYSVVEKECLAIRLAVQMFRVYLLGRPFTIQTDHRSLEWLDCLKDSNNGLMKWSLALQPFQFTMQYRTGKANADALSRVFAAAATGVSLEKDGGVSWSKVDPEENEESNESGLMKGCQTSERVTVNPLACAGSKVYKSRELSDI